MQADAVSKTSLKILSDTQRAAYFNDGFLLLPGFLDDRWLTRIREVSAAFVEESRTVSKSNGQFDLEAGHSAQTPKLRRLSHPVDHHEVFRELAFDSPIVDLAEDLLGPDVCYHHSKLNYKWSGGGEGVKWHQDIQFWPHTDFSPLTIGIYLEDVDAEMGPMGIVPGSHRGPLFDLADGNGRWTGYMADDAVARAGVERTVYLEGVAGSVTVHNCCAVHGSAANHSDRVRPLLLQTYCAGSAWPIMGIGTNGLGRYANTMVRGRRPTHFEVAGRSLPVAPDWSGGYTSIFDVQQDA